MSQNFPDPYPHNTDCTWSITVQEDRTVQLNFTQFDVEGHDTCNYDRVTVSSRALQVGRNSRVLDSHLYQTELFWL